MWCVQKGTSVGSVIVDSVTFSVGFWLEFISLDMEQQEEVSSKKIMISVFCLSLSFLLHVFIYNNAKILFKKFKFAFYLLLNNLILKRQKFHKIFDSLLLITQN